MWLAEAVREAPRWSAICEVGGDGVPNWRVRPFRFYRSRGVYFVPLSSISGGLSTNSSLPVHPGPATTPLSPRRTELDAIGLKLQSRLTQLGRWRE